MTLESKIRELVPSLQELSFGCEVKILRNSGFGDVMLKRFGDRVWVVTKDGFSLNTDNGFSYTKMEEVFQNKKSFEILGHPIQLHHIHQAIHKASPGMSYILDAKGNFYAYNVLSEVPKKLNAQWDLTKDLSGQSEETKAFLTEILL